MKNLVKNLSLSILSLFTVFVFVSSSWAIELDDAVRTIPLNSTKTVKRLRMLTERFFTKFFIR